MKGLDNNDSAENRKSIKEFFMIAIPVGAFIILAVALLITGIFVTEKIKNRKKDNPDAVTETVSSESGDTVSENGTDMSDNSDISDSGTENTDNAESGSENNSGKKVTYGNSILDTGNLSQKGSGYEGTKGTGKYNYGEALQKSLLFYELQRSGDLPEKVRCNWRGDSCLNDGKDAGIDLTGGWFDAGDNVKFNLPMSYSASMLAWSVYEDKEAYEEAGQLEYALSNIKWANDYFIKCHPKDDVYYYQVGNGSQDHSFWGSGEVVEYRMNRPSYCVTKDKPGSAVCGETAASLALCSIVYKDTDEAYSKKCLEHAKSLYKFARDTKSDSGYTEANGFYDSWSGFYDELAWSGVWLYLATNDQTYLNNAKTDYNSANQDFNWSMCWDDVHIGAAVMLAKITGEDKYKNAVEKHLDWWSTGTSNGERITYTPKGLAWLDSWGSLRYATTTAYVASIYAESDACTSSKKKAYEDFALSQANYALGDTGFSYEIGFGKQYPHNPHHRTAQGSYCDNMNEPNPGRHILYGALVGGPDASDNYTDTVSNYNTNEVACDYNAGFTGLLAHLYSKYKGQTIKDFGAVEETGLEIYADGGINVSGSDFVEIKALVYNISGWPARVPDSVELRYFVDLSEVIDAGGSPSDLEITTNYMQSGRSDGLKVWDESKNIYYVSIVFDDGKLYPGGQEHYKQEIQVRIRNKKGVWDDSNDPSYKGLSNNGISLAKNMAVYENGKLVFGTTPPSGDNAGEQIIASDPGDGQNPGNGDSGNDDNGGNSVKPSEVIDSNDNIAFKVEYTGDGKSSVSGTIEITNNSDNAIDLSKTDITYYFTSDNISSYVFDNYHSAVNTKSGDYKALSNVTGSFEDAKGNDTDKKCVIKIGDSVSLKKGDTFTVSFAIHASDWSNINITNDYSYKNKDGIVVRSNGKILYGKEP
ncbi:MAG: glycoside hydrolase family 9 protein [Lachnospiraceae bacterium]|nr:glycoside hydrolase family 9 protein [Lachnospiraceae bacterium]